MVRISKQNERRAQCPRKRRPKPANNHSSAPTEKPAQAFKSHANALSGESATQAFIPKIK